MPVTIRPMLPFEADPAAEVVLRGGWGDRRLFFSFAASHPGCRAFVAEEGGELAGTGIATINGPVGWVGAIFVAPERRGRGLGQALTGAVIDALEGAGCRTLVLVATEAGRPLYERLGFEARTWYHTVEAPGTAGAAPVPTGAGELRAARVRPYTPADLGTIAALDRAATGEDRRHLLEAFATPASARCLEHDDGTLGGFVVRAPWGGGATVAPDPEDALAILAARRAAAPSEKKVRAGVLAENAAGLERLRACGWTEAWSAPRLVRGDALDWRPEELWGQFNHAIG